MGIGAHDDIHEPDSGLGVGVCAPDPATSILICRTLEAAGHTVVAREAGLENLLARLEGSTCDCVVLEVEHPSRASGKAVGFIRSELRAARVVLVSGRARDGDVRLALGFGADGVVLSERAELALGAVVSVVCMGQVSVPSNHREAIGERVLTTREKQILGLVVMGLTNAQIAAKLFLAESTVKSHLSSAFGKLEVSSRNEAAGLILDPERGRGLGIITVPGERITSGLSPFSSPDGLTPIGGKSTQIG